MLIIGSIIWVLLLIWLLLLLIPSETMQRDSSGNTAYYAIWLLLLGLALFLHYRVMVTLHHKALAMATDIIGLLLFIGVQYLRFRYYNNRRVDDDRIPDNRLHSTRRTDLSGLRVDPPGTVVNSSDEDRS